MEASDDSLSTHFRQAALSITQLYKETTKASRRAYAQGYASCLQDLWLLLSTADSNSSITVHVNNDGRHDRRVLTLENLAAFARSKQDILDQSGLAFGGCNNTNEKVTSATNQLSTTATHDHITPSQQPTVANINTSNNNNNIVSKCLNHSSGMRKDRSNTPRGANEQSHTLPSRQTSSIQTLSIPQLQPNTYASTSPSFTFSVPPPSSNPAFFQSYNGDPPFSFGHGNEHHKDTYISTSDGSLKRRRNNNQHTDDMMCNFFGASLPATINSENYHHAPSTKKGRYRRSDDRMMSD